MEVAKKIDIVGAGLAGLGAGINLARQGFEVKIYEGRKYMGGDLSYADSTLLDLPTIENELGVEVEVHVLPLFDHPGGKFGGDIDPLPIAVGKGAAQDIFAFPGMVGPGRIQVVDSLIDGITDLANCAGFVNLPFFGKGQAHAAKPQDGQFVTVFRHCSVEHVVLLVCLQMVLDSSGLKIREGFWSQIPSFSLLSNLNEQLYLLR